MREREKEKNKSTNPPHAGSGISIQAQLVYNMTKWMCDASKPPAMHLVLWTLHIHLSHGEPCSATCSFLLLEHPPSPPPLLSCNYIYTCRQPHKSRHYQPLQRMKLSNSSSSAFWEQFWLYLNCFLHRTHTQSIYCILLQVWMFRLLLSEDCITMLGYCDGIIDLATATTNSLDRTTQSLPESRRKKVSSVIKMCHRLHVRACISVMPDTLFNNR